MATWEDGPEYAPVQRPSEFADAPVPPLEVVPAVVDHAAGAPLEHPRFDQPAQPVAALSTLVPPVADVRDPRQPFEVVTATVTEASAAWSAAHYTAPSGGAATQPFMPWEQPAAGWPAPTTAAAHPGSPAPPSQPGPAPTADPGPYARPGTPGWFAPPPPGSVPVAGPPPLTPGRLFNAAAPGALICLLVGALVYPLSPVTLAVAAGLSTRATAAQRQLRIAYGIALGLLGLIGFILLASGQDFAGWWIDVSRAGQALSFAMIAASLVLVGLGLRGRLGPSPRRPGTWG